MKHEEQLIVTTVDALGHIKADIKSMDELADAHKAILISAATEEPGSSTKFVGVNFTACVTFADRSFTDWKAVVETLAEVAGVSHQALSGLIRKNTSTVPGLPTVRVTERK